MKITSLSQLENLLIKKTITRIIFLILTHNYKYYVMVYIRKDISSIFLFRPQKFTECRFKDIL